MALAEKRANTGLEPTALNNDVACLDNDPPRLGPKPLACPTMSLAPILFTILIAQAAPSQSVNLHLPYYDWNACPFECCIYSGGVLPVTSAVLTLVAAYEARKILPKKFVPDMTHIALATTAEVDAIVSWNFRHIVRLEKIRMFNAVNVELGYRALSILSPREVTTYEGH